MRVIFLASSLALMSSTAVWGFHVPSRSSSPAFVRSTSTTKHYVAASEPDVGEVAADLGMSTAIAKEELLELVKELKSKYGILLVDSKAKESFAFAVEKLEEVAEPPTDTSLLTGEWTLMCTTATSKQGISGIDTSKLPFFNEGPLKDLRDTINQSLTVEQIIKAGDTSDGIDEIDHVVDYMPPNKLSSVFKSLPDNLPVAIKELDINPLKVSETKVVLKHKAEIESVIPVMKTKLSLQSIVLNVAGTSQILEPTGDDVLGVNIPFGDSLSAGSFETTFLDDTLRISHSKVGPVDQIRVFVKTELETVTPDVVAEDDDDDDELAEDPNAVDVIVVLEDDDDDEVVDSPSDVEG